LSRSLFLSFLSSRRRSTRARRVLLLGKSQTGTRRTPQNPAGNASMIARTPRQRERKQTLKKGGISGAPKGISPSLSLFRVPRLNSRSASASLSPPCLHPLSPFRRASILFLSCAFTYTCACTHTRLYARTCVRLSLYLSHIPALIHSRSLLSLCRDSLPSRSSLPSCAPRSSPRGKIDSRRSYPTPRPRRVCIHAPLAPTFRDPGHGSLPPFVLCSPSIVRKGLTPCALLSRKTRYKMPPLL